ncbi:MAG TPA: hypothetical protein PL187_17785 [Caldilinea sp.]|nr:hypothetical protein [Caldilinea sp.]
MLGLIVSPKRVVSGAASCCSGTISGQVDSCVPSSGPTSARAVAKATSSHANAPGRRCSGGQAIAAPYKATPSRRYPATRQATAASTAAQRFTGSQSNSTASALCNGAGGSKRRVSSQRSGQPMKSASTTKGCQPSGSQRPGSKIKGVRHRIQSGSKRNRREIIKR